MKTLIANRVGQNLWAELSIALARVENSMMVPAMMPAIAGPVLVQSVSMRQHALESMRLLNDEREEALRARGLDLRERELDLQEKELSRRELEESKRNERSAYDQAGAGCLMMLQYQSPVDGTLNRVAQEMVSGDAQQALMGDSQSTPRFDEGDQIALSEQHADALPEEDITLVKPAFDVANVGFRCKVFWKKEGKYFSGKIEQIDSQRGAFVKYDDGDKGWEKVLELLRVYKRRAPIFAAKTERSSSRTLQNLPPRARKAVKVLGMKDGWGVDSARAWKSSL